MRVVVDERGTVVTATEVEPARHATEPFQRCSDDLEGEAAAWAAKLEADYPNERLAALAKNQGYEETK